MRWLARAALAALALTALYLALWEWLRSGTAPQGLARAYDGVARLVGPDPHTRCFLPAAQFNGHTVLSELDPRNCNDWQSPRVFDGIYVDEFEGQRFLEGAKSAERYVSRDRVWLNLDHRTQLGPLVPIRPDDGKTRVYHVRFSGRKTARPGRYGHFGMSSEEIVVDRILQARLVSTIDDRVLDGMMSGDPQLR